MLDCITENYPSEVFRDKKSPQFLRMLQASLDNDGQDWIANIFVRRGEEIGEDDGDGRESPIAYFRRIQSSRRSMWPGRVVE